eukprot:CAMPEP_0202454088 /NCGR_PEP_ID=MMETSP1360-20130828/11900_1 /ASSEMBLY_ACC=CAM_ASM_000848 /TAXON_ID=515479 /ORGANISM="Licmophora paradoxa, Strain CCMP2313" /LENGTH=438 /DNA_ID=CAMNT_0049073319 /DNA_START=68 /DNA_END=1384 /DNA_ORIENTATION=+
MTEYIHPKRVGRAISIEEMEAHKIKGSQQNIDALLEYADKEEEVPKEFFGAEVKLGNVSDDVEPIQAPVKRQVRFGVVGEGKDRKILGYGSSAYIEPTTETIPWVCLKCSFENPDSNERKCGMCEAMSGPARKVRKSSMMFGMQAMPSVAEGQTFEDSTEANGDLWTKNRNSIVLDGMLGMNALIEDPDDEDNEEGEVTKENLMMSFANWSISDTGGWSCPSCTYMNQSSMHLSCEVCETPRPVKKNPTTIGQYGSVSEFLTASFCTQGGNVNEEVERQLNAFAEFEGMVVEQERMEEMLDIQRERIIEIHQSTTSNAGGATATLACSPEVQAELAASAKRLREVESIYENEMKEFRAMEELQKQKAREIEMSDGINPREVMENRVQRPGAQSISSTTLNWIGQQRMLDDWRKQLGEKQEEIDFLQQTHQACQQSAGL